MISNKIKTVAAGSAAVIGTALNASATFAASDKKLHCPGDYKSTVTDLSECNNLKDANSNSNDLMSTVNTIINVIIGVIGFVAVVVIILGGVQYTTSAGDPGKVKKAKDTILYGIIGLVVALLAYAIVNFVLSSLLASK
jgi:type IV secretory pathway VirB2 component (pilin)